ncbi:MAG: DNA translocase FtsK 4TM domain-containing protein, partial [Saprospiraceae bacterium]
MARSKKSKLSAGDAFVLWLKDERLSKILAILCFMMALFILISSISYFFTWKADQDKILNYSWKILFNPKVVITNWLGKLGALSSHILFYYGFGLAAILFIPVLIHLGFRFLHRGGWLSFLRFTTHSMVIMSLLSMIFYYIFQTLNFPYGGAFGARNCEWIEGFMGPIGAGLSLIFGLIALLVWYYNPSMQTFQADAVGHTAASSLWNAEWFNLKNAFHSFTQTDKPSPEQFLKTTANPIPQQKPIMVDWSDYPESDDLLASLAPKEVKTKVQPTLEIIEDPEAAYIPPAFQNTEQSDHQYSHQAVSEEEDGWEAETGADYDPKANLSSYKAPGLELLHDYADQKFEIDRDELETNKNLIIATLQHYKIEIQKIKATIGPTVTLYEIVPAPGVRISRIKSLEDDIALSLSAQGIRIIAPIPGKGTIGIEVANKNRQTVPLKELLRSEKFNDPKLELPIALGKNISNEVIVADLTKMPHLLIAGATGQGKSVGINAILMSLLYRKHPAEVKLVLIDPKKVELPIYSVIAKHFLAQLPNSDESIITDNSKVIYTLNSLCIEMDQRYELLKLARVRNILEYNDKFTKRKLNPEKGHKY